MFIGKRALSMHLVIGPQAIIAGAICPHILAMTTKHAIYKCTSVRCPALFELQGAITMHDILFPLATITKLRRDVRPGTMAESQYIVYHKHITSTIVALIIIYIVASICC